MKRWINNPFVIWGFFMSVVFFMGSWITITQHDNYWKATIARTQVIEFNMLHASLPYALAFLEEHKKPDLMQQLLNANFGEFSIVYADNHGSIIRSTQNLIPQVRLDDGHLAGARFSYVYKKPFPLQFAAKSPYDNDAFNSVAPPNPLADAYGKVYLVGRDVPSFWETLTSRENWLRVWQRIKLGPEPIDDCIQDIIVNFSFMALVFGLSLWSAGLYKRFQEGREIQHRLERWYLITEKQLIEQELLGLHKEKQELMMQIERDYDERIMDEEKHREEVRFKNEKIQALNEDLKDISARLSGLEAANGDEITDRLGTMLNFVWPSLQFDHRAIRQLNKIYRSYPGEAKNISDMLSLLEIYGGDYNHARGFKSGIIIEPWKGETEVPITKVKLNKCRIYFHAGTGQKSIAYIVRLKTDETDIKARKFLRYWRP